MLYLFYGTDDLGRSEYVAGLLARVADPMGDLNQMRFDGEKLSFSELRHACDSIPFLSDRRIVIVEGLLARLAKRGPKEFAERLRDYLPAIPDYTRLFLLESEVDKRTALWKALVTLSEQKPPTVFLREFAAPAAEALPEWIQRRGQRHGARIERRVATELATFVGGNLRLLDQELMKLATYAGDRPISSEDLKLLVPYMQEATIWEMVDAIGARNAKGALNAAQKLLRDDPGKAIYLHTMIARQVRMLLQVAELLALGQDQGTIQRTLGMNPYVLKKVIQQARSFPVERLERAFDLLLASDVAMKSGADQVMTLNLLIVDLAGRQAA